MSCYLGDKTKDQMARSLAQFLPNDKLFEAKCIDGSNLNGLLNGLGRELLRVNESIDELACNYLISESNQFLPEWESMVGIPDDCFSGTGTDEERTRDVLIKLASLNAITEDDWIQIAALLGFKIKIIHGTECGIYPFPNKYPFCYFSTAKQARFTMIIVVDGIQPGIYPFLNLYPFPYSSNVNTILTCIFNKIKPADTQLLFRFEEIPC